MCDEVGVRRKQTSFPFLLRPCMEINDIVAIQDSIDSHSNLICVFLSLFYVIKSFNLSRLKSTVGCIREICTNSIVFKKAKQKRVKEISKGSISDKMRGKESNQG